MPEPKTHIPWTQALRASGPVQASPRPLSRTLSRLATGWRRWDRVILSALALVALALGVRGAKLWDDAEFSNRGWHPLSTALKLFFLNGPTKGVGLPVELEVARVVAPLLSIYAVLATALAVARDRWTGLCVGRWEGHAIVCGLGRHGSRLVSDLRRAGRQVVVLEKIAAGPRVERARREGAVVLEGDALDADCLARVRPERARLVAAVCGDDGTNVGVALRVHERRIATRARGDAAPVTRCAAQVNGPELRRRLREGDMLDAVRHRLDIRYVDLYESAARIACADILATSLARRAGPDRPAHLVVLGLGRLGEAVVLAAARSPHAVCSPCLRLTIVGRDATDQWASLVRRCPGLKDVVTCEVRPVEIHDGPELVGLVEELDRSDTPVGAIVVSLRDEAVGLTLAVALRPFAVQRRIPVLLRLSNESALAHAARSPELVGLRTDHVRAIGVLDDLCTAESVEETSLDRVAEAVHGAYLVVVAKEEESRRRAGKELEPRRASQQPWTLLGDPWRDSSRRQADHIPWKLTRLGFEAAPVKDPRPARPIPDDALETLAQLEHLRWTAEKRIEGYVGPDDAGAIADRPVHANLVPWDRLDEPTKEKDRAAIRAIPAQLEAARLKIVERELTT